MNKVFLSFVLLMALLVSFPLTSGADDKTDSLEISQNTPVSKEETQQPVNEQASASVIQSFGSDQSAKSELVAVDDKMKRLVMFIMGVPLLILIFTTAALGVAMGVYGKQVFVPHMVCAGLSLTLALGHAVVGIVWFYPF